MVNGKILCSRNEEALSVSNLPKAYKLGGQWECGSGYKFCGNQEDTNPRQVACVPEEYMCPINKMEFVDGQLKTYTDFTDGSPLVDVRLSQGGPPCVEFMTDFNSLADK